MTEARALQLSGSSPNSYFNIGGRCREQEFLVLLPESNSRLDLRALEGKDFKSLMAFLWIKSPPGNIACSHLSPSSRVASS
jgi:hypothetical protein